MSDFKETVKITFGLLLLALSVLILGATVMSVGGCATAQTIDGPTGPLPPLAFEIVHQRRMGFEGMGLWQRSLTHTRIGHVINRRAVPVKVTIDCDLSYWSPIEVPAATASGEGELWFNLRAEDQTCTAGPAKKD